MLTTLLFIIGIIFVWRRPSWGRVIGFASSIAVVYLALVWVSSGYYLHEARADLSAHWNVVVLGAAAWFAAFLLVGAVLNVIRRRARHLD